MLDKPSVMPKKNRDARRRIDVARIGRAFCNAFALLLREAIALIEGNADFGGAEHAIEVCLGAR